MVSTKGSLIEIQTHMAVGQNQWYHLGVGAPPNFRTYLSGDWDVHWGYDWDVDPWAMWEPF